MTVANKSTYPVHLHVVLLYEKQQENHENRAPAPPSRTPKSLGILFRKVVNLTFQGARVETVRENKECKDNAGVVGEQISNHDKHCN